MSERIGVDEAAHAGWSRLVRARLDAAIAATGGDDVDDAVHDVRKALKKARALLRLARGALGEATYHHENRACRDAGRRLAAARDTRARIDTLAALRETFEGPLDDRPFPAVRGALVAAHEAALAALADDDALARVAAELHDVRDRVDAWAFDRKGFAAFAEGVERVHRRGRRARRAVEAARRPQRFHEWRKRAKYLRYQLDALAAVWPAMVEPYVGELHRLTDLLGDAHDLVVLDEALDGLDGVELSERLAVRGLADARRRRLEDEARALGAKLYADRPRAFVERLRRWWRIEHGR